MTNRPVPPHRPEQRGTRPHVPDTQRRASTRDGRMPAAQLHFKYNATPATTGVQVADVIDTWRDRGWTD
jgi:hypothetical protein